MKAIDSMFASLKQYKIKNLILDLRDNQGGDFEPSRYLLSYLTDSPTKHLISGEETGGNRVIIRGNPVELGPSEYKFQNLYINHYIRY